MSYYQSLSLYSWSDYDLKGLGVRMGTATQQECCFAVLRSYSFGDVTIRIGIVILPRNGLFDLDRFWDFLFGYDSNIITIKG